MEYAIIYEGDAEGFSAYAPDIPGCGAAAKTKEELRSLIREAIEFHLEGLAQSGYPVPLPTLSCEMVEIQPPRVQPAAAE